MNDKYPGIPKKFHRNKDGSDMYPNRDMFDSALMSYAKKHGIDGKKLVKDIKKEDDFTYKKMITKFNKEKRKRT